MKHVSNKPWSSIDLLYNRKKGILLRNVSRDYISEIRRRMSKDKNYMSWLRKDDYERYQEEMGRLEFDDLMSKHGYDELCHDTDYSECSSVMYSINQLIKEKAIKNRFSRYTIYKDSGDAIKCICRCGDWYFVPNEYFLVKESKEIDYEKLDSIKKSGGARVGAGRKNQYAKLKYPETTTIKVPRWDADNIKRLIIWLVDNNSRNVSTALSRAKYLLDDKASEVESFSPENAAEYREMSNLLDGLRDVMPWFTYKEEDSRDSSSKPNA